MNSPRKSLVGNSIGVVVGFVPLSIASAPVPHESIPVCVCVCVCSWLCHLQT